MEEPLEAPDMNPRVIFDPSALLLILVFSLMLAAPLARHIGSTGALIAFLVLAYNFLKLYRNVVNRFPPGYWGDKLTWIGTKPIYYPGKSKKAAPLLRE